MKLFKLLKLFFLLVLCDSGLYAITDFANYRMQPCSGSIADFLLNEHKNPASLSELNDLYFKKYDLLYGDTLSRYIRSLTYKLTASQSGLKDKVMCLVVRSPYIFADISAEGYIFMSTALISQSDNESQLALVMAHYLAHADLHHIRTDGNRNSDFYHSNLEEKVSDLRNKCQNFFRHEEKDADIRALEIFIDAGFASIDKSVIKAVLPPLGNAGYNWNTEALSSPGCHLPVVLNLNDSTLRFAGTGPFGIPEQCVSHFADEERYELISRTLNHKSSAKTLSAISVDTDFETMRRIARLETTLQMQVCGYPLEALYACSALDKDFGPSFFTQSIKAQALYILCLQKLDRTKQKYQRIDLAEMNTEWELKQGEIKKLHYFFNRISGPELAVLASSAMYKLYEQNNDVVTLKKLEHLFYLMNKEHNFSQYEFKTKIEDSLYLEDPSSLYHAKIRRNALIYFNYAFYDIAKPEQMRAIYAKTKSEAVLMKDNEELMKAYRKKLKTLDAKFGRVYGLNSICIFNTEFYDVSTVSFFTDTGMTNLLIDSRFRSNRNQLRELQAMSKEVSAMTGMKTSEYERVSEVSDYTGWYESYQALRRWQNEKIAYADLKFQAYSHQFLSKLKDTSFIRLRFIRHGNEIVLVSHVFDAANDALVMSESVSLRKCKLKSPRLKLTLYGVFDHLHQQAYRLEKQKSINETQN